MCDFDFTPHFVIIIVDVVVVVVVVFAVDVDIDESELCLPSYISIVFSLLSFLFIFLCLFVYVSFLLCDGRASSFIFHYCFYLPLNVSMRLLFGAQLFYGMLLVQWKSVSMINGIFSHAFGGVWPS